MTFRPRNFRLGSMRERITVQTATFTVDTAGQSVPTWATTYASEPASFTPVSGGETLRGSQVQDGVSAVFTVHFRSDYVPEMRIVYGGVNYGIVYVRHVQGGRRYTELHCKAAP